ncbi:MAG: hypothetical protein J6U54_15820 [Clostridiales bacterium]|nr:hypothetical protein [Clostridiales bacterium]
MAAYVHVDPINIKFILEYIKNKYGDTEYNKVLTYKGSTGNYGIEKSLQDLITFANEHDGNLPTNFIVVLIIEYNNSVMTGNFLINILQVWNANIDTSKCRPYYVTYKGGSSVYFNCYAAKISNSNWSYYGAGIFKMLSMGCTGTSSTKSMQYVNPSGTINNTNALNYEPDFTMSNLSAARATGGIPNYYQLNQLSPNLIKWSTQPCYRSRNETSSSQTYPLVVAEKGLSYYGTYDLTDAEKERYIDYEAPLIMMEETQPFDGINCFDLSFNGMTYVAERHQHEAGMFVRLLDEVSTHSKVIFTNETIGKAYDQVSYAKPFLVPDEVFSKPGLIRADVYGTGGSSSTVQKQFYFKVKENPSTRTVLSGLTMGTNIKPIRIKHNNRIEFLWSHTGSSNPAIEILDDDMMVKYMDIWNDSNPNVKYQISPSSGKFAIPLSYFDLKGTFHGLVRCGNNKIDSVVTEIIWNFE